MSTKGNLSERERKRLELLEKAWGEEVGKLVAMSLSPADLRLLFEHFEPLQALVRRLATDAPLAEALDANEKPRSAGKKPARAQCDDLETRVRQLEDELGHAYQMARQAQQQLADVERQNRIQQQRFEAELKEAREDLRKAQAVANNERLARQACEGRVAELKAQSHFGTAGQAFAALRADPEIASRLGLSGLGDDVDSLVRVVAVLAQKDNVLRLLDALSDSAQKRKEPLAAGERALINAAVRWLNHNWQTKPYELEEPKHGTAFESDRHRRARYTPTGETINRVLVPGLRSSTGALEYKPVVETR